MRDLCGAIFKNNRKNDARQPDYRGSVMVGGVDYWLSGWINTSQSGEKYIGIRLEPKQQQADAAQPQANRQKPAAGSPGASGFDDMTDDVPF